MPGGLLLCVSSAISWRLIHANPTSAPGSAPPPLSGGKMDGMLTFAESTEPRLANVPEQARSQTRTLAVRVRIGIYEKLPGSR